MLHAWNALNTCMFDPIFLQTSDTRFIGNISVGRDIVMRFTVFECPFPMVKRWFNFDEKKKSSFHGDQIHELIWVDWPWSSLYTSLKSVSIIYFYAHTFPSFETTKQRILKIVCIYLLRLLLHDPLIFKSFIKGSVTCVQPNNYNLLVNSHTYTCPKWTR